MKRISRWPTVAYALALCCWATTAAGQVKPETTVHRTVNGVFFLCPRLVGADGVFPPSELSSLGFEAAPESGPLPARYVGIGDGDYLLVRFDGSNKRCTVTYSGSGFKAIAGVVRDTVIQNGFKRITGGDKGGAKADVFEGSARGRAKIARIIIIENYTDSSAAISYAER